MAVGVHPDIAKMLSIPLYGIIWCDHNLRRVQHRCAFLFPYMGFRWIWKGKIKAVKAPSFYSLIWDFDALEKLLEDSIVLYAFYSLIWDFLLLAELIRGGGGVSLSIPLYGILLLT